MGAKLQSNFHNIEVFLTGILTLVKGLRLKGLGLHILPYAHKLPLLAPKGGLVWALASASALTLVKV